MNMRVGHGFDIHPLVQGRALILGGVHIASDVGCAGHSDADVVMHSVADAILGACGMGDIGEWFPDDDEEYRGADSAVLLGRVSAAARDVGARPVNADVTVYLERPKLADFKAAIRSRLAEILDLAPACVGFKARTFEGFGAIGAGTACAASAVVLIEMASLSG